jgi:hypothetical protein
MSDSSVVKSDSGDVMRGSFTIAIPFSTSRANPFTAESAYRGDTRLSLNNLGGFQRRAPGPPSCVLAVAFSSEVRR